MKRVNVLLVTTCLYLYLVYKHIEAPGHLCVLVRTTKKHFMNNFTSILEPTYRARGKAFFFVTDNSDTDDVLKSIVKAHNFSGNGIFLRTPKDLRRPYDPIDAGYRVTDHFISAIIDTYLCTWLLITNGDNSYGKDALNIDYKDHDLVLLPFDSRNIHQLIFNENKEVYWNNRCVHYNALSKLECTLAAPEISHVDLGGVLWKTSSWKHHKLSFNVIDIRERSKKYSLLECRGCQDGMLVQYCNAAGLQIKIVKNTALSSCFFHGPSPLHCVTDMSGNVWFDHPSVHSVECLSAEKFKSIPITSNYDYKYAGGPFKCLRLSSLSFDPNTQVRWCPRDSERGVKNVNCDWLKFVQRPSTLYEKGTSANGKDMPCRA